MKLAIEVDGEIHNDADVTAYDEVRTKNLIENGITVLRFLNDEVERDLKKVIKKMNNGLMKMIWLNLNHFLKK